MEANGDSPGANTSTNITADEIDEETATKLRGDAIGDTMYSEVFVLNTLLQFSDLKWSPEVEDNLCFLWDMTEEKDVCQYLFRASYPALACSAIQNYTEPRFIEIVVGIFANLLCSQCDKHVGEEEIKTVLNLLQSNDPYILIQVMRFVHAVSFLFETLEFIEEEHLDRFGFILGNSTNKELLTVSLKVLASITSDTKIKENVLKGELLMSAISGYRTLNEDCETDCEMFESDEKYVNVRNIIQFVCNLCGYIDILKVNRLVNELNPHLGEFTSEITFLLNYYKNKDHLLPVDEIFKFYIDAITYIYKVLNVGYISSVAKQLYDIFCILHSTKSSSLDSVVELFCYFISVGSLELFQKDFENVSREEIKKVLLYIERSNFTFDFEYVDNLKEILKEL